ncbi:MAG: efflux RND transporter periplasmic adaptor subunit, partial [Burkholderiales bacterium]
RRQATVSAKLTARVTEVLIDEGQQVTEGEVIARLDDSNVRAVWVRDNAQLAQARASQRAAQSALANEELLFARMRLQRERSAGSLQDFDTAKARFEAAQAAVDVATQAVAVAEANLAIAQRNLDDTLVRAPFSGIVTVKAAQPGEMVSPVSAGGGFTRTGIGTIVDMASLEVDVDVSESFINRIAAGQPVLVQLNAYPDWDIEGHVITVVPTADRARATVKVRIALAVRDPRILPEMGARVSFLRGATDNRSDPPAATGL